MKFYKGFIINIGFIKLFYISLSIVVSLLTISVASAMDDNDMVPNNKVVRSSGNDTAVPFSGLFYRIKCKHNGKVLNVHGDDKLVYPIEDDAPNHTHRLWQLVPSYDSSYCRIKCKHNGKVLNVHGDDKLVYPIEDDASNHTHRLWEFIPTGYKITALITDFQYDSPPEDILEKYKKPVDIIEKRTISNNSGAELTDTVSYSKTFTNTFSYGFKESLNFTAKTEVKAGIPFTTSTKAEFSLSVGFEANQQITKSDSVTYNITKQVKVPAFTSVRISAYANWIENLEMPFEATVKITALADRLMRNGNIARDKSVDGNVVSQFLSHHNFKGNIIRIEGDVVFAKISGKFIGSYGLDSVFSSDKI